MAVDVYAPSWCTECYDSMSDLCYRRLPVLGRAAVTPWGRVRYGRHRDAQRPGLTAESCTVALTQSVPMPRPGRAKNVTCDILSYVTFYLHSDRVPRVLA